MAAAGGCTTRQRGARSAALGAAADDWLDAGAAAAVKGVTAAGRGGARDCNDAAGRSLEASLRAMDPPEARVRRPPALLECVSPVPPPTAAAAMDAAVRVPRVGGTPRHEAAALFGRAIPIAPPPKVGFADPPAGVSAATLVGGGCKESCGGADVAGGALPGRASARCRCCRCCGSASSPNSHGELAGPDGPDLLATGGLRLGSVMVRIIGAEEGRDSLAAPPSGPLPLPSTSVHACPAAVDCPVHPQDWCLGSIFFARGGARSETVRPVCACCFVGRGARPGGGGEGGRWVFTVTTD